MARFQDDYGGHAYGSRKRVLNGRGQVVSMRCLDCQKLRYLTRLELFRASLPRCLACRAGQDARNQVDTIDADS